MNVWSNGNDRIVYDDATKMYQFVIDGEVKMEITVDGNDGVVVLKRHGTIKSSGDLRIHLDDNFVAAPTPEAKLRVFDGRDVEAFSVNQQGEVIIHRGEIQTRIVTSNAATGWDDSMTVASGANRRGRVEIRNQPEIGHVGEEFYQPKKAGILVLHDEGGRKNYLWVDSTGKLRISRSDPEVNDLSGTVVGTQS